MIEELTTEQLAHLRRLYAAANPGQWESLRQGNQYLDTDYMPTAQCVAASRIIGPRRPWNPHKYIAFGFKPEEFETVRFTDDTADFVAAIVNAAPQLLAMAERVVEAERIKRALSWALDEHIQYIAKLEQQLAAAGEPVRTTIND